MDVDLKAQVPPPPPQTEDLEPPQGKPSSAEQASVALSSAPSTQDVEGAQPSAAEAQHRLKAMVDEHVVPRGVKVWERVRPWRSFAKGMTIATIQEEQPEGRLARIRNNLDYFKGNYALVFGTTLLIGIFQDVTYVLALAAVAFAWFMFIRKNFADPSWRPVVQGYELSAETRWYMLSGGSLLLLLIVSWNMLLFVAFLTGFVALAHASFHPGPAAVEDTEQSRAYQQQALEEGNPVVPAVLGAPVPSRDGPQDPNVVIGIPVGLPVSSFGGAVAPAVVMGERRK
mmetsp:Transcript_11178/g.20330  ORF Transcript_11178/g.20330 Transcript_11178/m.20330 type:complete len:285 (+) Transcript_11178:58-912(+)